MVALRLLGLLRYLPAEHSMGWLAAIGYLSPARYQSGLWEAGLRGPLMSVTAYLLIGAMFVGLAQARLKARDL
jgi:hypothetical protein